MAQVLEMQKVVKSFSGTPVLQIQELHLAQGEHMALRGRSGSGKSTLLNLVAGLLAPDAGSIRVDGVDLASLGESGRDRFRGQRMGYVFQSFHLLQGLTVWENLWLAAALAGKPDPARLNDFLTRLDLNDRRNYRPSQLSLGQQQRVAVARALVHQPRLVLADEPTGNLDAELAQQALQLLVDMCRECGAALLLVSHDRAILEQFENCQDLAELNGAASC
jgi:ABC-type lipoprotein export system ATPase subunit